MTDHSGMFAFSATFNILAMLMINAAKHKEGQDTRSSLSQNIGKEN